MLQQEIVSHQNRVKREALAGRGKGTRKPKSTLTKFQRMLRGTEETETGNEIQEFLNLLESVDL